MAIMFEKIDNLHLFNRRLEACRDQAKRVAKCSLFDGAKVAADSLRTAVDGLNRVPDVVAINTLRKGGQSLISVSQKNGLRAGLGVAHMKEAGDRITVSIGFGGYNSVAGGKYPRGQPNRMIAGSCEGGSSKMIRQPFIRPTFEAHRIDIQRAMMQTATRIIDEIMDS